jgi:hypothetical protein
MFGPWTERRPSGQEDDMTPAYLKLAALAGTLMLTAACLQRDVTETWYVDDSGAVTWVIHEQNVRSDSQSPLDRQSEEGEYWLAVQQDRHDMREGLRELGGDRLRTVVLRGEAPFSVQTDARFTGLDALGQRLIAAIGTTGTSLVKHTGQDWEWTLLVRDPSALGAAFEPSTGVGTVLDSLDRLKVVLVAGRFVDAEGFELSRDRRVATFNHQDPAATTTDQPAITLRLSWKGGER